MREAAWVFGLSIDDEITWALAPVRPAHWVFERDAYLRLDFPHGKICDLPNKAGTSSPAPVSIADAVLQTLYALRKDKLLRPILDAVESVGVSTIGLTDHHDKKLLKLARKSLVHEKRGSGGFIVDFKKLFADQFPGLRKGSPALAIQNDATAKCMAHYRFQNRLRRSQVLCFINLSVGVNIGLANQRGALVPRSHPELGHAYPCLHNHDYGSDSASQFGGCPIHDTCFESLLSAQRFRGEWGQGIHDLPEIEDDLAWDIAANYTGQLCWNAVVGTAPAEILLGGRTACDQLVQLARSEFARLNAGGNDWKRAYLDFDIARIALAPHLPIKSDGSIKEIDGLVGALELARLRLLHPEPEADRQ